MSEKLVLIDGHSILNRAFFGIPDLSNSEGLHTNAVYGFLNILFRILEEEQPDYLTVAFDVSAPTFRHKMYADYKGTRKPMAAELREQVPVMKELLQAMGVTIVEKAGYEADDLLGTIAKRAQAQGMMVSIVSGDRDLLQLASEHIKIRIPKTKKTGTEVEDYFAAQVTEKYGVTPTEFIDVKALMGDTSDNVPGVPGIGEKTAVKIIGQYGSIENAYAHIDDMPKSKVRESFRENYEKARFSKKLVTIETDAEIAYDVEQAKLGNLYTPQAYELCRRLEFKNILTRFQGHGGQTEQNPVRQYFKKISDAAQAAHIFETLRHAEQCAVQLVEEKGAIYGMSAAVSEKEVYFIQVSPECVSEKELCDRFAQVLTSGKRVASFDVKHALKFVDIPAQKQLFDVTIAAYLLNPLKSEYTYEDLAKDYLGQMFPSRADLIGKQSYAAAMQEHPQAFLEAVCYPAYTAFCTMDILTRKLTETGMQALFAEIEMPLVYTLSDMEKEGIRCEAAALEEYGAKLLERISQLETMIYEGAGETFNINSPKQLGVVLFEKLNMPYGKKTKTGYSTAADVLDKLAPEYPLVAQILEYRQLSKLKSTYADGLAAVIGEDGRIHTTFNQTITATGRLSSTEPNLQNIPIRMELGRLIRKVFLPREGCVFLDADYSQIELRVLAHMSADENLIQAYKEAQDIHRMTASQVFHIPFAEVTDLQRRNAKAVNFGIVYGISSFGLSQDLSITRKEAQDYIEQYFRTYPGVKAFLDRMVKEAKETGQVVSLYGRIRPVPELKSGNFMQRSFGERVAMNSPIQGTAADIIKIAMNRVHDRLLAEGLKSRLILQVHDELLVETFQEETQQVSEILEQEMHHAADLAVALEIDMHSGTNWYEAK
ncbi:DNA polymerase I [Eubacterium plexicaudatum ASF492]|uniref:DNA polymerase I n=1 Tax=Eubacterium plexicaudatum ASF492 TaxID=1235802 RepID=N2ALN5_9FIRM|nr:DNA polymerase I [Eubacterium plexicaudatum ASF492]